ncbi:MAG TPA: hypothetical protein VMP08_09590, partial [Anaerolineae bacterium]|nr:hypothetical protein [Anaerolineae bacterium]
MAAVVLTAIGFVLLEDFLQNTDGHVLATIGATAYLFGGVLIVAAETLSLTWEYEKVYGLAVIYVVVACLGRSASGRSVGGLDWLGHTLVEHRVHNRTLRNRATCSLFPGP